jgi:hypothetical protein
VQENAPNRLPLPMTAIARKGFTFLCERGFVIKFLMFHV